VKVSADGHGVVSHAGVRMLRELADLTASRRNNSRLDKRDKVTLDSIRTHFGRHFPVQHFAKATYREILERRARENQAEFVEGIATALTPIAFLEAVLVKSYETLVWTRSWSSPCDA
jgi:hypothetical protein